MQNKRNRLQTWKIEQGRDSSNKIAKCLQSRLTEKWMKIHTLCNFAIGEWPLSLKQSHFAPPPKKLQQPNLKNWHLSNSYSCIHRHQPDSHHRIPLPLTELSQGIPPQSATPHTQSLALHLTTRNFRRRISKVLKGSRFVQLEWGKGINKAICYRRLGCEWRLSWIQISFFGCLQNLHGKTSQFLKDAEMLRRGNKIGSISCQIPFLSILPLSCLFEGYWGLHTYTN